MELIKRIDGLVIIIMSLFYLFLVTEVEKSVVIDNRLGANVFPAIIGGILLINGIVLFITKNCVDHLKVWPSQSVWRKILLLVFVLTVYAYSFEILGFILSNIFICIYLSILLKGNKLKALMAAILITGFIQIIFGVILDISLPEGVLEYFYTLGQDYQ